MPGDDPLPSYVPRTKRRHPVPPHERPQDTFKAIIEKELGRLYRDPKKQQRSPGTRLTYKEKMVQAAIQQASAGNLAALIELMNRTEGKVADRVQADVTHTFLVVPWDDENAPGIEYKPNQNLTDRPDVDTTALPPPDASYQFKARSLVGKDDLYANDPTVHPEIIVEATNDDWQVAGRENGKDGKDSGGGS